MTAPLISIVIPAYNAAPFLAGTLASVFAQDHRPIDVILVDDGSSDETLALAKAWQPALRIHHQANAGPSAARNRGIAMAAGDYLAFIDADDLWLAGRLTRQLSLLERDPALDMVLGLIQLDYQAGDVETAARFRSDQPAIALFSFGAGLFRRRVFERVGLLSEDLRNTEDADWFMRAREAGATWLLEDQAALIYRRHGTNMTEHLPLAKSEMFRVLARATARKRAGAAPHDLRRLTDKPLPAAADRKAGS